MDVSFPALEATIIIFPFCLINGVIFSVKSAVEKKFVSKVNAATFSLKSSPLTATPALLSNMSTYLNYAVNYVIN